MTTTQPRFETQPIWNPLEQTHSKKIITGATSATTQPRPNHDQRPISAADPRPTSHSSQLADPRPRPNHADPQPTTHNHADPQPTTTTDPRRHPRPKHRTHNPTTNHDQQPKHRT